MALKPRYKLRRTTRDSTEGSTPRTFCGSTKTGLEIWACLNGFIVVQRVA